MSQNGLWLKKVGSPVLAVCILEFNLFSSIYNIICFNGNQLVWFHFKSCLNLVLLKVYLTLPLRHKNNLKIFGNYNCTTITKTIFYLVSLFMTRRKSLASRHTIFKLFLTSFRKLVISFANK